MIPPRCLPQLFRRLRTLTSLVLTLACLGFARAESSTPPGCDVFWQWFPEWNLEGDARLKVRIVTPVGEAGSREWQPAPDNPAIMAGPRHLVGLGQALLPLPPGMAARTHLQMCLRVEGLDDTQVLTSNMHAEPAGPDRLLRWQGNPALLRELVVATGSLLQRDRQVGGLRVRLLLAPVLAERAEVLADEAAAVLGAQRHHWRSSDSGKALVILHTDDRGAPPVSLSRSQAVLLRAPSAVFMPGPAFRLSLTRADLRGWFRERFGPTVYEQQPDETANAWFVDGFSLLYALRWAATEEDWPLQDFAAALTALWGQDGLSATGPWLAMKWHTHLRQQGSDGLDPLLRQLVVPADQARPMGRLSSPQAGHRLFAALRPRLGDEPRRDVQQWTQASSPPSLQSNDIGPCFQLLPQERRVLPAPPSAACQGWLGGVTSEASASTRLPVDATERRRASKPSTARASGVSGAASASKTSALKKRGKGSKGKAPRRRS